MTFSPQTNDPSRGIRRVPWLTIVISLIAVALYAVGADVFNVLVLDKIAVASGESWRILTGHMVHMSWSHFFWDLLAFAVIGGVVERYDRRALLPSLLVSCLAVSGWFLLADTQWASYSGLSGALNGLLVVGVWTLWRAEKNPAVALVLVLTFAKILFEILTHQTVFSDVGSRAVPQAHAVGFAAGCVYVLGRAVLHKFRFPIVMSRNHS